MTLDTPGLEHVCDLHVVVDPPVSGVLHFVLESKI